MVTRGVSSRGYIQYSTGAVCVSVSVSLHMAARSEYRQVGTCPYRCGMV